MRLQPILFPTRLPLLLLLCLILLSGCGIAKWDITPEVKIVKSYKIGDVYKVPVGSPMLRVEKLHLIPAFTPAFEHQPPYAGVNEMAKLQPGQVWIAMHQTQNGFILMDPTYSENIGINIKPNGVVENGWINIHSSSVMMQMTWDKEPLFKKIKSVRDKVGFAEELIYSGLMQATVRIAYREFVDDMARPAFYQELTYNLDESRSIIFRTIKLEVIEATNSYLSFKVLDDGNTAVDEAGNESEDSAKANIRMPRINSHALDFGGVGDVNYVIIGSSSAFDTDEITFEAWIKPTGLPTGTYIREGRSTIVWNGDKAGAKDPYIFYINEFGKLEAHTDFERGSKFIHGSTVVTLDTWHHVALTISSNRMELFLDGKRDAELDHNFGTAIKGHSYIALGRHIYRANPFGGIMDEVRIWRTVRTKAEIQDNMWAGSIRGDEPDLVGYWNFDEGDGRILNDSTRYENHGDIHDAEWTEDSAPTSIAN